MCLGILMISCIAGKKMEGLGDQTSLSHLSIRWLKLESWNSCLAMVMVLLGVGDVERIGFNLDWICALGIKLGSESSIAPTSLFWIREYVTTILSS